MLKNNLLKVLGGLLFFISSQVYANIVLPSLYFNINEAVSLQSISNSSETSSEFVKVVVKELKWDEKSSEYIEVNLDDPSRFVISPSRIVVAPKQSVPFRMISKSTNKLALYRVTFLSIPPTVEDGFSESDVAQKNEEVTTKLRLNINMGAIVFVNPTDKKFNTVISSDADSVTIENNGNSVISLNYLKVCDKNGDCEHPPQEYIMPNKQLTIDGFDIKFKAEEQESSKSYHFIEGKAK